MRAFAIAVVAASVLATDAAPLDGTSFPAGKIAFGRTGEHGRDIGEIYVMNPDGTGQRNLTRHPGDDHSYRWSPDGRRIVFVRQSRRTGRRESWINVYVMNADGSAVRRLTSTETSDSPVWSPDGARIAFRKAGDLHVMNADGTGVRRITTRRLLGRDPEWSARDKIAFFRYGSDAVSTSFWMVNPDGSALRRLTRNQYGDKGLTWSPSGDRLAFNRRRPGGRDGFVAVFVIDAGGGKPRRITPWSADDFVKPVWSPDGGRIAFVGRSGALYTVGSEGRGLRRLTRGSRTGVQSPTWSPDGRRLAFTRHPAIFVVNADGSGDRRLVPTQGKPAFSQHENWSPRWSPPAP